MTTSLSKALIINIDKSGEQIECLFNPKEYSISKQNSWNASKNGGQNTPQMEFGGGSPATLQMQLLFDTYGTKEDVRKKYTDKIWNLMMVDESLKDKKNKKGRPPVVRFQWGEGSSKWSFNAVITSLKQQFTLFHSDGSPLRATLDVTFQQVTDPSMLPKQNPTSGGVGGERVWRVRAGDTLAWIAHKELGDATAWRRIADANGLTQVRRLAPGSVLVIPND